MKSTNNTFIVAWLLPTLICSLSIFRGMTLSEVKRLKALEEENARLKRIVAQQALDKELLREVNAKNGKPSCAEVSSEVSAQ